MFITYMIVIFHPDPFCFSISWILIRQISTRIRNTADEISSRLTLGKTFRDFNAECFQIVAWAVLLLFVKILPRISLISVLYTLSCIPYVGCNLVNKYLSMQVHNQCKGCQLRKLIGTIQNQRPKHTLQAPRPDCQCSFRPGTPQCWPTEGSCSRRWQPGNPAKLQNIKKKYI